jgi:hypothetical protein
MSLNGSAPRIHFDFALHCTLTMAPGGHRHHNGGKAGRRMPVPPISRFWSAFEPYVRLLSVKVSLRHMIVDESENP